MDDSIQPCSECQQPFNLKLRTCPHCGASRPRSDERSTTAPGRPAPSRPRKARRKRKPMNPLVGRLHDAKRVIVPLIAIAIVVWLYLTWERGPRAGELEARQRFVDEISQFEHFDAHADLILSTIDETHAHIFMDHRDIRRGVGRRGGNLPGPFIWDRYRLSLYQKVMSDLRLGAPKDDEAEKLIHDLELFMARPPREP